MPGLMDQMYQTLLAKQLQLPDNPQAAMLAAQQEYDDLASPAIPNMPAYGMGGMKVGQIMDSRQRRLMLEKYLQLSAGPTQLRPEAVPAAPPSAAGGPQ